MEQHTLQRPIRAHGTGLHSGQRVGVTLFPAPVDHGVVFLRTDLPTAPAVRLGQAQASETTLCTGLAENGHDSESKHGLKMQAVDPEQFA